MRQRYPALSIALLEESRFDTPRLGEVLPAAAAGILEQLNVADAFEREQFRPVHGSAVSWGHAALADLPHLFTLHGPAWHLDRTRFDALLAREAARNGAGLQLNTRAAVIEKSGEFWRLRLNAGEVAHCRFLVDATGRRASIVRRLGTRLIASDHLVGFVCVYSVPGDEDFRTLIESAECGWWYTAALEGGTRIVALMTDADVGRDLDLSAPECWRKCLRETRHVAHAVAHARLLRGPVVRSANSQHVEPVAAENWIAIGDAAMALDPLSGQGIVAALRSGIFAAYAIGDQLTRGDSSGLRRYQLFIQSSLASFERARTRYYAEEPRWPHPFWSRRASTGSRIQFSAVSHRAI